MSFSASDQQDLFQSVVEEAASKKDDPPNSPDIPLIEDDPENIPLSTEEENFALAIVESSGNPAEAYRLVFGKDPMARAKACALLAKQQIATRVSRLQEAVTESSLISIGSHLMELADIRDLGKVTGQLKVALHAEIKRGEVAGYYSNPASPPTTPNVNIAINMASPEDLMNYANKKMAIVEDVTPKE